MSGFKPIKKSGSFGIGDKVLYLGKQGTIVHAYCSNQKEKWIVYTVDFGDARGILYLRENEIKPIQ